MTFTPKYTPQDIDSSKTGALTQEDLAQLQADASSEAKDIAEKLRRHMELVRDFRDKIEAVEFLIESARNKAGNLKFLTNDPVVLTAIENLGFSGNEVDFKMFREAVAILVKQVEEQALISLTGGRE